MMETELMSGPKYRVFTCLGQFENWFLVEGIFLPMMGTQLGMRPFPGRLFQGVLLNISAMSLGPKVWKFLFSRLSCCSLQEHLLPLQTNSHLGKGLAINSPFLDGLGAACRSLLQSDPFTTWSSNFTDTTNTFKGDT